MMARKKCAYEECVKQEQQAGVCLNHFYEEYRTEARMNVDDLWEFVKGELKING
jgi:hypothetical protein